MQKRNKKYKLAAYILVTILLAGILINAAGLWILNRVFPPETLYATHELTADITMRLSVLRALENISGMCIMTYNLGMVVLIHNFVKSCPPISFLKLLQFFFITNAAMFVCAVPFALLDKRFWGNYLFPIWSVLVVNVLFFLFVAGKYLIKNCKEKRSN